MNTFGLNMIAGPGDAKDLKECLDSFRALDIFDEIVIVNTCHDDDIDIVANDYNAKLYRFEWCSEEYPFGNFGGARQCALENSESDYIMWLDCDDRCFPEAQKHIDNLRECIKKLDRDIKYFNIPYDVLFDENLKAVTSFSKERIFKNDGTFFWRRPVHEAFIDDPELVEEDQKGFIQNFSVSHVGNKPPEMSAMRNVKILEHEYKKLYGKHDPHIEFYYGRDLLISGDAKGLDILKKYVDSTCTHKNNLYLASSEILNYYAYGAFEYCPTLESLKFEENKEEIQSWSYVSIALLNDRAEPYCIMGDWHFRNGDVESAERFYKLALQQKINKGMGVQSYLYYEYIPAERLARIYSGVGKYEEALFYLKRAMIHKPESELCLHMRKQILDKLNKIYN